MKKIFPLLLLAVMLLSTFASSIVVAQDSATSGSITVYTALEDDQIEAYLASFREEYPDIEVNIVRDSTGIITARLLAEKDNPQADVVWGLAVTSLLVLKQEGMLEAYAPEGLDRVNPLFRDADEVPSWVGIDVWMSAFCVNTIEIEALDLPMPTSWEDLTDPVYEGYIVMSNPNSSGTGFLSVSAMLQLLGEDELEDDTIAVEDFAGWDYLDALHNNIAQYVHSGSKPCRMAGAGEYPIGISFDYRGFTQVEAGDPIEVVFPEEGSGWDVEANGLMKKDEINPAAMTFLDWAIGDEVMAEYAQNYAITSVPTDQPLPEGYPDNDPFGQIIDNDFEWAAAYREDILTEWLARYDEKSEAQ